MLLTYVKHISYISVSQTSTLNSSIVSYRMVIPTKKLLMLLIWQICCTMLINKLFALRHISSWMSANLLTLNSSKTEFLNIGLKQQLSKIDDSSLNRPTTHSARNLGFIFDENLTFSYQSHHFLSPAILLFVSSAVSVLTFILKQPVPLSTLNLTTVTLSLLQSS